MDKAKYWHKDNLGNPDDYTFGSMKVMKWQCPMAIDHCWESSCNILYHTKNCPFCIGRRASITNCLSTIRPNLAKQWHPTLNGDLLPTQITCGSKTKVWWLDETCGHSWDTRITHRIHDKSGCPFCTNFGKRVSIENSVYSTHPHLIEEWSLDNEVSLAEVTYGSCEKMKWICKINPVHIWDATVSSRISICKTTGKPRGCPYCPVNGRRASPTDNLAIHFPKIALEWHPTKNGLLLPTDIMPHSSKKVSWLCENNHEFETTVVVRSAAENGSLCPFCPKSRSKGELEVIKCLNLLNIHYKEEVKFDNCRNINLLSFDFQVFLENEFIIIEYNGIQHYKASGWFGGEDKLKQNQYNDAIKLKYCQDNNIELIVIHYKDFDRIEEILTNRFQPQESPC